MVEIEELGDLHFHGGRGVGQSVDVIDSDGCSGLYFAHGVAVVGGAFGRHGDFLLHAVLVDGDAGGGAEGLGLIGVVGEGEGEADGVGVVVGLDHLSVVDGHLVGGVLGGFGLLGLLLLGGVAASVGAVGIRV